MGLPLVAALLGGTPEQGPERYASASPAALAPLGVSQSLVHGTADDIVPFELSQRYAACAAERGDHLVNLVTLEGAGHFEFIDPASTAWPVVPYEVRRLLA